jgi:hypothetical protein
MMPTRFCDRGGLLVDSETRLPSDLCEFYQKELLVLVGCNRLRCSRCHEWVRSGPPGLGLKRGVDVSVAALYTSENWIELPFVERRRPVLVDDKELRLYVCRCRSWQVTQVDCLDYEDSDFPNLDLPWACAGHPLPAFPATLGDLTLASDTDWEQLVAKILGGVCPRSLSAPDVTEGAGLWLAWLYVYLAGLPVSEQLASAIGDRIDDRDPLVVGRVLYFFSIFPRATGIERVIARAEAAVDRVAVGYAIPEHDYSSTIWQAVVARLEQRSDAPDPLDVRAGDVLRKALLIPLPSLSHQEMVPTDRAEIKRHRLAQLGGDVDSKYTKMYLDEYAQMKRKERIDVVVSTLEHFSSAFDDAELRIWIADHIVEIDAAAPGRWRLLMNMLADWYGKPELGHLIVVAGMRLIDGGVVGADEFRDWIEKRRAYGWVDDAWVLPLTSVLERQPR